MNIVFFILDIIPLFFVLIYMSNAIFTRKVVEENRMISLYGGGGYKLLKLVIIIYLIVITILFILWFLGIINPKTHPFIYYGYLIPISVYYYSSIKGIYIGKKGIVLNRKYYTWSDKQIRNISFHNQQKNFNYPSYIKIEIGKKRVKAFVPKQEDNNVKEIFEDINKLSL